MSVNLRGSGNVGKMIRNVSCSWEHHWNRFDFIRISFLLNPI